MPRGKRVALESREARYARLVKLLAAQGRTSREIKLLLRDDFANLGFGDRSSKKALNTAFRVLTVLLVPGRVQRPAEPYLFSILALVLPRRLWEEELGDALEVLHALRKSGAPPWQIQVKIFSTFAWSLVNALREVMSAVTGQPREREK